MFYVNSFIVTEFYILKNWNSKNKIHFIFHSGTTVNVVHTLDLKNEIIRKKTIYTGQTLMTDIAQLRNVVVITFSIYK